MEKNKNENMRKKLCSRYLSVNSLYRLFAAWLIVAIVTLSQSSSAFTTSDFFQDIPYAFFILLLICLWLLFCTIENNQLISGIVILSSLIYCILAVQEDNSIYFAFGCCILVSGVIAFSHALPTPFARLSDRASWAAAIILILAFTIWIGGVCCLIYRQNWTPSFDFGIFAQMYYYMKKTGLPYTTCERDMLLNHFNIHISPIFYLLLPVYYLLPSPQTLMVAQCLVTASGIIPLMLLCKNHRLSNRASVGLSACYAMYSAFIGGCFYYIHENNFLAPLVLWMVYFFEKRKVILGVISTVLLLSVKEDAAVYAAVISLYFLVRDYLIKPASEKTSEKEAAAEAVALTEDMAEPPTDAAADTEMNTSDIDTQAKTVPPADAMPKETEADIKSRVSALAGRFPSILTDFRSWMLLASVAYFFLAIHILSTSGNGAMTNRYNNYIYDSSGSLLTMIKTILQNPIYVITQCFTQEKLGCALQIFLPLCFLPLLTTKWERLILLIPYMLFNMMSSYPYQHVLTTQYYFGSGALLFYLAAINYADLGKCRRKMLLVGMCCAAILSLSVHQRNLVRYYPDYRNHGDERTTISEALDKIPDDASVAATAFFVAPLSSRDEVYDLYYTDEQCDYVVIDMRGGGGIEDYNRFLADSAYELSDYTEGVIAVFRLIS